MKKAPDAFRTISEVSEILETPAHVLRFWESKFYQIRPVKRAGGRRYYRPDDVALINGIRVLLQDQGMTIRGVQRVLQDQGVKHVAALGLPLPASASSDAEQDDDLLEGVTVDGIEDAEVIETVEAEAAASHGAEGDAAPDADDIAAEAMTDAATEDRPVAPARHEDEGAMTDSETLAPPAALTEERAPVADNAVTEPAVAPPAPVAARRPAPPVEASAPAEHPPTEPAAVDSLRLAQALRTMPRGSLGGKRDSLEILARRMDVLLERMSEASGAGRW